MKHEKKVWKALIPWLCQWKCPTLPSFSECEASWLSQFPDLKENKDATCRSHVQGVHNSQLHCCEACLECVFISCPRTPTEPICSPAFLSSSTAASCVVTALRFILSPIVILRSPGISISCSLVSFFHHQQHPSSLHLVFPCLLRSREQSSTEGNCTHCNKYLCRV